MNRKVLIDLITFYKDTQQTGLKDSEAQIQMFADECLWLSFSDPQVISGGGVQTATSKEELLALFEKYNNTVRDLHQIDIKYLNEFADDENQICGFSMLITIQKDSASKPSKFFNTLHLHVNKSQKVYKAFNWMGVVQNQSVVDNFIL